MSADSTTAAGPFAVLANLKIKTKVVLGFLVVLALLVGLGAMSVLGFRATLDDFVKYRAIADNALGVAVADGDLAEMRRHAFIFSETGAVASVTRFREVAASARKGIDEAIPRFTSEERRAQAREIGGLLGEYVGHFDKVVQLRQALDKLVAERLDPSGRTAREKLDAVLDSAVGDRDFEAAAIAGKAQVALMQVRLNVNRFLATSDPKMAEAARAQFALFSKEHESLMARLRNPERRRAAQEVGEAMTAYGAAGDEVAKLVAETQQMITRTMAGVAERASERSDALRAAQSKALGDIGDATSQTIGATITSTTGIAVGAIALGLLLAWLIGSGTANPVVAMTGVMGKLSAGDTSQVIPSRGRKDEIGQMAEAVQVFKDNMIETDRLRGEQEAAKQRAEAEKKASMNRMADEFEASVKGVVQIVSSASTELQSTAQSMSATAEETSRQASAVAAASEQASTNVQTVASATEELSSSIAEIGKQVGESSRITTHAVEEAGRTNAKIKELAEAAQKIGDVVKLISGIAGQTNLLALNATIEAARAGEAGKGFAVVASEVKSLANQTAKATEEISSKIAEMQLATGESVSAIESIGSTIGRINEITTTIAAAMEEQGAATQEIARNVQQASAGTADVSSNIVSVTKAAGDTGAAASQVLTSSSELSKQSETLRGEVDRFIARIRAA